jgi:glycine hydroxymethyltransferase
VAECIARMVKEGEAASEEVRAMVKGLTDKYPLG